MQREVVLFNGLAATDDPPGEVGRYRQLRAGAWLAGRLLVYTYPSFPRLWERNVEEANDDNFQYKWRHWVDAVQRMPLNDGSWDVLAQRVSEVGTTHGQISDIARAVIELVMRDAEIDRNSLRLRPKYLPPYVASTSNVIRANTTDEQQFMSKVRSATGYEPRLRKIELCIYRALRARNEQLVQIIADGAPRDCAVHEALASSQT